MLRFKELRAFSAATDRPFGTGKGCPPVTRSRKCMLLTDSRCVRHFFRCRFAQGTNRMRMGSISKAIACVCLLLTCAMAFALVVHHHSTSSESATCTVCVAAHSAAPKAIAKPLRAMFIPVSTIRVESVCAKQQLAAFALSVRPPPVS